MGHVQGTGGAVVLAVAAAIAVYAVSDNVVVDTACYLGVLAGAAVWAWVGARQAPHGKRLVSHLIAAGVTLSALGDVVWTVLDLTGGRTEVSVADPLWFASYLVLGTALWVLLRQDRGPGRVDLDFAIDALTIVVVSVLLFWSVSISTIVTDQSATAFDRTVWAAYPVGDAVLLALVVRVLMSRSARTVVDASFAVGVCIWLAADTAYLHAPATGALLVVMDAAWMVAPVLMASAAWRLRDVGPEPERHRDRGRATQLVLAVAPLMLPPALELVSDLRGRPDEPLLLFTGTAVLIALAFARTARLLRSEELARRELEVARDAALTASEAKSMFLANVSHEIRTPLTTVLASAELLDETDLDRTQLTLVAKMHRSGELLRNLVEGILDFSRIEAGRLELASTAFDLPAMVADTADVYQQRARQTALSFAWDIDPAVPQRVTGDPGRLFQILTNLLDNAFKFTHDGGVRLSVRPASSDAPDDPTTRVEFVVEDTGIGIRPEDLTSVFEAFNQVDGTMTRSYGGSGLGLAICRELTHLMGGVLTVRSQPGTGSRFALSLPLDPSAGPAPARLPVTSTGGPG